MTFISSNCIVVIACDGGIYVGIARYANLKKIAAINAADENDSRFTVSYSETQFTITAVGGTRTIGVIILKPKVN